MAPQRLNKYIATNMGISRREADDAIVSGQVAVNGEQAVLGGRVNSGDAVTVRGVNIAPADFVYLMLNKPVGYVSSRAKQDNTPTLYELLPPEYQALKTVGRLDKNSSGLILLTNDGDFAFAMTHPKFYKIKIYIVELDTALEPLHQQMIADFGVNLPDGPSRLALTALDDTRKRWRVEMSEGRNRQIRRTFGALGYAVVDLHRTDFGDYGLGDLALGKFVLVAK